MQQCLNCLRFGHIKLGCKGTERCKNCGIENHISTSCTSSKLNCANCKGEHSATDRNCPERNRQNEINITMGTRNLTFSEANIEHPKTYLNKFSYSLVTSNKFSSLHNYEDDFPTLENKTQSELPVFNNIKILHTDKFK